MMNDDFLEEGGLPESPFELFENWYRDLENFQMKEPSAVSLATYSRSGGVSQRTVLLKSYCEKGFVFFTNYESQKAKEIAETPEVSLLFWWPEQYRQVIVKGRAKKISQQESLSYFVTRPRGSQIGAWSSQQSSVISSRKVLENNWRQMKEKFSTGKIPLPSFWGGYRVEPTQIEFWQGRDHRLHDRFLYLLESSCQWKIERRSP